MGTRSLILEVKDSIDMMKATQQNFDYKVTMLDDRQMARESSKHHFSRNQSRVN